MNLSSRAITVICISIVFTVLALISLCARIWSRKITRLRLAANDYAIIIAMVLTAAACSMNNTAVFRGGEGQHVENVTPEQVIIFLKVFLVAQILWAGANSFVKTSILLLYIKLFTGKVLHILCYVTIAITWCYFISVFLEALLLCRPVEFNWNKSITGGRCKHQHSAYLASGLMNLALDITVVLLPMPTLWTLQLSWKKKIGVIGMFSLGFFICAVSTLRIVWLFNWVLEDLTYTLTPIAIYSILEPSLGVVNACLPVMAPVLRKSFGFERNRITENSGQGSRRYRNNGYSGSSKTTDLQSGIGNVQRPSMRDVVPAGISERGRRDSAIVEVSPLGEQRWVQENTIRLTTDWSVKSVPKRSSRASSNVK